MHAPHVPHVPHVPRLLGTFVSTLCAAGAAHATTVVIEGMPEGMPQPGQVDPRPPAMREGPKLAAGAAVEERVRRFLDRFVDPGKTPDEMAALFTEHVEYYEQGTVGRAAIVRDVSRYDRHWSQRQYTVTEVPYIMYDPLTNRAFVDYKVNYEVANDARRVRGQAEYGAVLADIEGQPKVAWIKEKVTRRQRAAPEE
jgi:hypothetical protein